jgi:hypothetical protein
MLDIERKHPNTFSVLNDAMGTKIFQMMREAFDGKEPLVVFDEYEGSVIFVQSKNGDLTIPPMVLSAAHLDERSLYYRNSGIAVDLSTDDWPFFYMSRRVYPVSYIVVLGLILLLSFVLYTSFFREAPEPSTLPFSFWVQDSCSWRPRRSRRWALLLGTPGR